MLVAAAASGPSSFVRASHDSGAVDFDYPSWVAGPLAGAGSSLSAAGWIVLAAIGIAHLAFFLGPPLWLTDAYNYLGFARLGVLHGLDPYTHALSGARGDELCAYSTWRHIPSPYGLLFTVASFRWRPPVRRSGCGCSRPSWWARAWAASPWWAGSRTSSDGVARPRCSWSVSTHCGWSMGWVAPTTTR